MEELVQIGQYDSIVHNIGHDLHYYHTRYTMIDFRGSLDIHSTAEFGFGIKIITATHEPDWLLGGSKFMIKRGVTIRRNVWVGSYSILFNCEIGEGCIVGIGSVVANVVIPPFCIVEGNPATITAVRRNDKWERIQSWKEALNS